jgi:hypothetical protein
MVWRSQNQGNNETLRLAAFFLGHADRTEKFQLLDKNLVTRQHSCFQSGTS